jgi:hypothetical protein
LRSGSKCGTEDGKPYAVGSVRSRQGSRSQRVEQVPEQVFPITQRTNDYDGEYIPPYYDDDNNNENDT